MYINEIMLKKQHHVILIRNYMRGYQRGAENSSFLCTISTLLYTKSLNGVSTIFTQHVPTLVIKVT